MSGRRAREATDRRRPAVIGAAASVAHSLTAAYTSGRDLEADSVTNGDSAVWIEDGEKYALIGLNVKIDGHLPPGKIAPNLWVLADTKFNVPPHWQEWLGSIRAQEVEGCNLFLLSKLASLTPNVLDVENQTLQDRVSNFYIGLQLASTFAPADRPVMLTGSRRDGEIDVRQQSDFDSPVPCLFRRYPPVMPEEIQLAAQFGEKLDALATTPPAGGCWRLFSTLQIYTKARTNGDILDRLHQYCRCIDGLILPDAGKTKRQFKSRTELFIGARHHDMMGELYDIRSAVEHLHENRYLESFDRATRLDLVEKEAIVDHIARTSLARIVGDDTLRPHFANTSSLAKFWKLTAVDWRRIWGDPIDPLDAIADFDPKNIRDGQLGAP